MSEASLDSTSSETQVIVDTATRAAFPKELDPDCRFHSVVVPDGGSLQVIDMEGHLEKYRDRPRRKTGTVHVHDATAFIAYLEKHTLPETEVWANLAANTLVAVVNAHQEVDSSDDAVAADNGAGYGDHRVNLELLKTDAWKAWAGLDRQWVEQTKFAEHIQDNALDVVTPDAATMLELAESFQATTKADFKSGQRLHSGVVTLKYEETQSTKAGENGDIDIPTEFVLELKPFEGANRYPVTARFRYRLAGSQLSLSYHLVNPNEVLKQAFLDYVTAVEEEITAPIFKGRPE